jgi:hypothetical protein
MDTPLGGQGIIDGDFDGRFPQPRDGLLPRLAVGHLPTDHPQAVPLPGLDVEPPPAVVHAEVHRVPVLLGL